MKELIVKTNDDEVRKEAKTHGVELLEKPDPLVQVVTKDDESKAVELSKKHKRIFLECQDWKVIPLENLIAKTQGAKLIALVKSAQEAKLALTTMEIGADGVVLETDSVSELKKAMQLMKGFTEENMVLLEEAQVVGIKQLEKGMRSCIDTTALMKMGEGMLVGSSSQGMLLIQAEVEENELAAPRPFRVNAGALSLYTLSTGNKTKYLEEIRSGDEVLLIERDGKSRTTNVARSKIEVRPLVLVEVKSKDGQSAVAILQNAETIRLVSRKSSIPVTELKRGDMILAHFMSGGRHFGTLVEKETIIER
jgi:3-dehydroquinate synthase II